MGREGEKVNAQEKHWLVASCTLLIRDLAHNPGMCPDWELNWWSFGLQDDAQVIELHQSGLFLSGFVFHLGCFFVYFGRLPVFVSMHYVNMQCLPVLVKWPYVVGVLWGPVLQSPWSPELGLHVCPLVGCVCPDVVEPWFLLWCDMRDWLSGWLVVRKDHDYREWAVVQRLPSSSGICFSGVLVLADSTIWICCLWCWLDGALV